jgi:UMF1 family MFS transporter
MDQQNINKNKKAVFGWTMYDWANSVYALAITTAIFPTYFSAISKEVALRQDGNFFIVPFLGMEVPSVSLYSYALSFSYFIIAVLSPLFGAIADYSGSKKKFMFGFCLLGSISCSLMYFFDKNTYSMGVILFFLAAIGYAGGNIFNDAFLPEVSDPEDYPKISARGYMMGYIGSVIQLLISLGLILKFDILGFSSKIDATKTSFLIVGLWWFLFAQITFATLKDQKKEINKNENILKKGFEELFKVLAEVKNDAYMKAFLLSFVFYNMGVQTIIYVAALFGTDELHLRQEQLILTVLFIQLVAIIGSQVFAYLSKKIGNLPTLLSGMVLWIIICCVAYTIDTAFQFYILACCVGFIMGGTQALSRATYSIFIPDGEDNASFFSFYSIADKISVILGLLSYGLINQLTHNMRTSILFLISYFVVGMILMIMLRKKLGTDNLAEFKKS